MSEQTGKKVWDKWMEELTPPYTVSYNPSGILYAKERIEELEAENKRLRATVNLMDEKARVAFNCFWNGGWYTVPNDWKGEVMSSVSSQDTHDEVTERIVALLESRNRDMQNRVDHYLNYAKRIEKENNALKEAARKAKALLDHATYHDGRYDQHTSPEWQKDACDTSNALAALIKEVGDETT